MRLQALERLNHTVYGVDLSVRLAGLKHLVSRVLHRSGFAPDWAGANKQLLAAVRKTKPDLVWIDKGVTIAPRTLRQIRANCSKTRLIHYSPDDMSGRHSRSWRYRMGIPLYHLHVTTKSFCVPELKGEGAKDVLFVNNAYCPETHVPLEISADDRVRFGGSVGFVGTFEAERANALWFLAQNNIPVRIWGEGWQPWAKKHMSPWLQVESRSVWGADYARTIAALDINLGFLRKLNRDLQTTRSVEIPACGGFLLAERTAEHTQLFREGKEAEFFEGTEELLAKCRYYLTHWEQRKRIAAAGYHRCVNSNYSYDGHVGAVIQYAVKGIVA